MTNEIHLSELAVLELLRDLGRPSVRTLSNRLGQQLRNRRAERPFGLGPYLSFEDFVLALDAAGFVALDREGNDFYVQLTEHGRECLARERRNLKQHFGFA